MSEKNLNLVNVAIILKKWKKHLAITFFTALIGSTILAFLLPIYYKSTVKFYPYSIKASDPRMAFSDRDYAVIGEDEDFERVISIGTSRQMYEFLIERFDLFNHYNIDKSTASYPYTTVNKQLLDNYSIRKTEKGVEITVYDKDEKFAAEMANTIVAEIEKLNTQLIMERNRGMADLYKSFLAESHRQIRTINDTINKLRVSYTVSDFLLENQVFSDKQSPTVLTYSSSSNEHFKNYKNNIEIIKKYDAQLKELAKELSQYELLYNQAISAIEKPFNTLLVIEGAVPAEMKARPIRSLWVAGITLGILLLAVCAILLIENYKEELKEIAAA